MLQWALFDRIAELSSSSWERVCVWLNSPETPFELRQLTHKFPSICQVKGRWMLACQTHLGKKPRLYLKNSLWNWNKSVKIFFFYAPLTFFFTLALSVSFQLHSVHMCIEQLTIVMNLRNQWKKMCVHIHVIIKGIATVIFCCIYSGDYAKCLSLFCILQVICG